MASVTSSLFGTLAGMGSPETLLQQRVQQAYGGNRQPGTAFFNASAGAGEQLLQSTQKLFGMEDEQVKQQRKLQAIIQGVQTQVDLSTPDGLSELANRLNEFPEFSGIALAMRQEAAKAKLAANEADLKQGFLRAQTETERYRQTELASRAEKNLREPTAKEDKIKTPADFAAAGISLGIPSKVNIADYTQDETARIRQQLQKDRESTAKAGVAASDKDFGNATALRENFLKETKDIDTGLKALYNVQQLLSERSGLADAIAKRQFAKFSGDRDISNKDIQAFGNFGTLGQRLEGILSQFLSGTYSEAQVEEASRVASNLLKNLQQNRSTIEQQYRIQAEASKIEPGRINFVVPSFTAPATPKERIPVPANIAQQKGWKTGQKVKRGNKTYTFDGTQLIED
jgi:hypothetical protein